MKEDEKELLIEFCIGGEGDCLYKPTKEDIQAMKENLESLEEWIDTKPMIQDELFCEIASHLYDDLIPKREYILNCWNKYLRGRLFLDKNYKPKQEIVETYGSIIFPEANEELTISTLEIKMLLKKSGFKVESEEVLENIKDELSRLWKNKKEMIVPSTLENNSKELEGISFKKFLFCEEYIKTGRIKTTCLNLGIGRTTAFEYMKDKEVQEYLETRKQEIKRESEEVFKQGINEAFEELLKIIKEDSRRDEVLNRKVKAIDTYLRHFENITRTRESDN